MRGSVVGSRGLSAVIVVSAILFDMHGSFADSDQYQIFHAKGWIVGPLYYGGIITVHAFTGKRVSGKVCCTTGMYTTMVGYSVNGDILQLKGDRPTAVYLG